MPTKGAAISGSVTMDLESLPARLDEFIQLMEHHELVKRLERIVSESKRPTVLDEQYAKRHAIAFGLHDLLVRRKIGRKPRTLFDHPWLYAAYSLVGAVSLVLPWMTDIALRKLRGQLLDGLHPDHDIRGVEHELRCIVAFLERGWSVELQDMESRGRFDLIARRGETAIEVEAKTVHGDTGSAVKYMEGKSIGLDVISKIEKSKIPKVPRIVKLSITKKLATDHQSRQAFLSAILENMASGQSVFNIDDDLVEIETDTPLLRNIVLPVTESSFQKLAMELRANYHAMVFSRSDRGIPTYVVIQSLRDSRLIKSVHETLRNAAKQLSGSKPGVIWTHLLDISDDQMRQLQEQYEAGGITGIEEICILNFKNLDRSHIFALTFSGEGEPRLKRSAGLDETRRTGKLIVRYNKNCRFNIDLDGKDWFFGDNGAIV